MFPLDHKPYIHSSKNSSSEIHPNPSLEAPHNKISACKNLFQPRSSHSSKQNQSDFRLGSPMEKMSLKSQDSLINHSKASDSYPNEEIGSITKNLNHVEPQCALDIESSQESGLYSTRLNKDNSVSIFNAEKNINPVDHHHIPMIEKRQATSLEIHVTNSSTSEDLEKRKTQNKTLSMEKNSPSSSDQHDYQEICSLDIPQEDESEPQISVIPHQQRVNHHHSTRLLNDNQRQNRLDQSGSEENQSLQTEESENPKEYISTESFLRITCVCLISVLFALSYVTDIIEKRQTADKLFYIAYGCLAYIIGEHIYVYKALESSVWEKREAFYNVLDGIAALLFAVSVQCCHFRYISRWYIIAAPALFGLFTTAYCFTSQAPKAQKDTKAILKSFYTVQTALIAAKICGYHFCDWRYILLPVGIYFGISACYGIIITFLFVSVTFVAICQWKIEILTYISKNIVGYMWYILYHATSIVIGAILFFIFSEREIREDNEMLQTAIDIWNYLCIVMFCYTIILYPCLKDFVKSILQTFSLVDENVKADLYQGKNRIKHLKSRRTTHFMMISPTYFVSLYEGFLLKSQERVKKLQSGDKNLNILYNVKDLKKDKEILDKKLDSSPQQIHKKLVRSNSVGNISQIPLQNLPKRYFEAEDLKQNNIQEESKDQGQNLCYICVVKEADSVIGQCGHGGVCEECVVLSIVHKNECMECRRPAKAIYKIEKTVKNSNIVKAVKKMQIV